MRNNLKQKTQMYLNQSANYIDTAKIAFDLILKSSILLYKYIITISNQVLHLRFVI